MLRNTVVCVELELLAGGYSSCWITILSRPTNQGRWGTPQAVIRYPDPAIEIFDQRFARYRIGSAAVERIWTGGAGPKARSGLVMVAA